MKKHMAVALTILMLFAIAGVSSAQAEDSNLDLGVKLGYTSPLGNFGDAFDGAFAGGLYLNYSFTPNFALQGGWLWHKHKASDDLSALADFVTSDALNVAALTDIRLTMNEFDVNGIFKMPMEGFEPYLLAGVGFDYWKLDGKVIVGNFSAQTDETFWDFGVNIGGGANFTVVDRVKLGGEIVYTYVFDEFDESFVNFLVTGSYGFSTGGR